MPSTTKKTPSKRSSAVRDISSPKRQKQDETFHIHRIEQPEDSASVEPLIESAPLEDETDQIEQQVEEALNNVASYREKEQEPDTEPKDFVRVKFARFVQLVTSRDCADVVNDNPEEDVVMSSNLLTDLAGAHDEREEKKIPLVFLVGLAIGVVLTYILIMK